jgi:hypothetical protein
MLMFLLGMSLGTCLGVVVAGMIRAARDPSPDDRQTTDGAEKEPTAPPASDSKDPLL